MTVRSTAGFAALLAVVLLVTGGCVGVGARGSDASGPAADSPSPTPPIAVTEFIAALDKTRAGPYHFTVQSALPENASVSGSGAFDGARQVYESRLTHVGGTLPGTSSRIAVGRDHFVRAADNNQWIHLDMSRVRKDNPLTYFDLSDPVGLTRFARTLNIVRRSGANSYEGTFNPERASPAFLPLGAPRMVTFGHDDVPFKATTDEQGRVTAITVELTEQGKPKITMKTTFSEHGKALTAKAPARFAEAADMYYQ